MGRIYVCPFVGLSVTNDSSQDIWEIIGHANGSFVLHSFELYSTHTSDERVNLSLLRRSTTGSGGSGATEVRALPGDAANSVAVNQLVTTQGTPGDIIQGFQWNQLAPLIYLPTPEKRIWSAASGRLCLALATAVGATRTWSGELTFEELF